MQDINEQAKNKIFLYSIVTNNYELPEGLDTFTFVKALLPNLGSNDSELRDDLTYTILTNSVIAPERLTTEQTKELVQAITDEKHLFHHIGERGNDSIFMRSFSNLIIAAILYNEVRKPAFDTATLQHIKDALFRYMREERDWRGYIEGKGWAHTMAHLADALDEYAQHPAWDQNDRKEILERLAELVKVPAALHDKEDIRLAKIAFHIILGKQVDSEFLQEWITSCADLREPDKTDIISWRSQNNTRNFLHSLFFLLYWEGLAQVIIEHITTTLKAMDEVYLDQAEAEE